MRGRAGRGARGDRAVLALLAAASAARLGVALWGTGRGYELGDEGYFLLNLWHPEGAPPPFEFYRLFSEIGGLRVGVAEARLLRIAVEGVGSVALVAGVFAWARARVFAPRTACFRRFLLLSLLGTLLSVASRSLGYNDLTNLFVYGAAGCVFAAAARPLGSRLGRAAAVGTAGLLAGIQLSIKFPSALLLAGAVSVVLALGLRALPPRERASLVALHGLAAAVGIAVVAAATGGAAEFAERLAIARQLPGITGYEPLALLERSFRLERWTYVNAAALAAVFGATAWRARRHGADLDSALARALAIGSVVLLLVVLPLHPTFLHWTLVYLACQLVFLPLALAALLVPRWRQDPSARAGALEKTVLLGFLIALPMIGMLGTNVPVTMRLPSHVLPLFTALAVAVGDLRARAGTVRFERGLAVGLVLLTSLVFAHHHWLAPYGLPRPLHEQVVELPRLPGIRADRASAAFLESVASALEHAGFRRGEGVLALDYMPGLVFYVGGVSPGSNLYMFDKPQLNCFWANRVPFGAPPWLILGGPMPVEQQSCLETISFPRDFGPPRAVLNPYERVYAGFGRPGFSHVLLFAPQPAAASDTTTGRTPGPVAPAAQYP
jgi:hypothetical protein